MVEVDLRHSDAEIIMALGPLYLNFGGTFGETSLARDVRMVVDGLKVTKPFDVLEDAEEWQNYLTQELRGRMRDLRTIFLTQYPIDFDLRHRRV